MIQTLAIGAALLAVAVGVWRDYAAILTLKRAAMAYLAVYFVAGAMYLVSSAALRAVKEKPAPQEPGAGQTARKRKIGENNARASHDAVEPAISAAYENGQTQTAVEADIPR